MTCCSMGHATTDLQFPPVLFTTCLPPYLPAHLKIVSWQDDPYAAAHANSVQPAGPGVYSKNHALSTALSLFCVPSRSQPLCGPCLQFTICRWGWGMTRTGARPGTPFGAAMVQVCLHVHSAL